MIGRLARPREVHGDLVGMCSEGGKQGGVSNGKDEVPGCVHQPCNGITSARGAPVT